MMKIIDLTPDPGPDRYVFCEGHKLKPRLHIKVCRKCEHYPFCTEAQDKEKEILEWMSKQ